MSLNTLLEAAEFLEWRNQPKTRADDATQEAHGYTKSSTNGGSDTSPESSNSGQNMYITLMDLEDLREKRRAGGAGTREVHNKLEKNRRAHLKECFDFLKKQIPTLEDKRSSNLGILRGSIRYIQALKRKEREYEQEMQRLAREKISLRERMSSLKSELAAMNIEVDLNQWKTLPEEYDSNSTSTATEQGSPICSEDEEDEELRGSKRKHSSSSGKEGKSGMINTPTGQPSQQQTKDAPHKANNMTVVKVGPPPNKQAAATGKNPPPASLPVAPKQAVDGKPAVTKLLAQTLERRQLKHQQEMLKQNLFPKTSTTGTATPLNIPRVPAIQTIRPPPRQQLAFPLGMGAQILAASPAAQLAALNKLAAQATVSMPMSGLAAIPISTLAKGFTQPFLVSMGNIAAASPQTITTATTTTGVTTTTAVTQATSSSATVTTSTSSGAAKPSALQTALNTAALPVHAIPVTALATVPPRPFLGVTGATAQMFGHIPFGHILATHALPRTSVPSVLAQVTTVTGVTTSTAQTVTTTLQSPTVQQLMAAQQGAQLLSPMTVMSPTINLTPGLTQAQLTSMLSQPLLKQIPFPMFHQGLIQGPQVGSVLSQPVVRPLVVVSIPSVVTTSVATTTSVSATSASSSSS